MTFVVYHNPACGTSRNVLEAIVAAGHQPVVIEYLKTGWTVAQLQGLFAAADLTPREGLRVKNTAAAELGLLDEGISDATILQAMVDHPVLVNRPIVCCPKGVKLCRPSATVAELLE